MSSLFRTNQRGLLNSAVSYFFSSATIANIGDPVWAVTDNHGDLTLSDPGTTKTTTDLVGYVHNIDDAGNVVIKFIARLN